MSSAVAGRAKNESLRRANSVYFGIGAIYLVLILTLGILTIRKGHWVMFLIGIILPIFWIIGAIMPPVGRRR
jgi:hypothetical protein